MKSNKKKSSKKKKQAKTPTETGLVSQNGRCDNCGTPESPSLPLKVCNRCGMAVYCSVNCQKDAYREHKYFCKQTAADFNRNDRDACNRILFSRCFGGAVSLLMHRALYVNKLKGIIHVKCSHPLVEFSEARRNVDKRYLTIRFVPEGEELLALQERALSDGQPKKDEDGDGALELAKVCTDTLIAECLHLSPDFPQRVITVAVEQEGVKGLKMFGFFSYMEPTHQAHSLFCQYAQNRGLLDQLSRCIVLDWDWEQRNLNQAAKSLSSDEDYFIIDGIHYDFMIQWFCYNSIGPKFYQENSLVYQESIRKKEISPWPNGELRPPLALSMEVRHKEGEGYTMMFGMR